MPPLRKAEECSVIQTLMAKPDIYLSELQYKLFQSTGTWANTSTIL